MLSKYAFLFLAILSFGLKVSPVSAQKNELAVVAYYSGRPDDLEKCEIEKLTHLIFCFGHLKGNDLDIGRGGMMISKMVALKKRNPKLKVLVSLGGWGGCAACSEVFSTNEGRKEFARSVKKIQEQYGTDGIDLDWEYPVVVGYPGHKRSPDDKNNFTALVKTLRSTLPKKSLITFAAGGYSAYIDSAIAWKEVMKVVDFVNLMSYDLVNGYATVTGHHTALYSSTPEMESTDRGVNILLKHGVPASKIVIGAAFYGRIWKDVPDVNHGLYQSGVFFHGENYKNFGKMLAPGSGFTEYWDSVVKAPYAYNPAAKQFMTYDDKRSIRLKTQYVIDNKLKGIMFWELAGDKFTDGLLDEIWKVKEASNRK